MTETQDRLITYLESLATALPKYRHPIMMVRGYALGTDPETALRTYYPGPYTLASAQERAAIALAFEHVGWTL